MERSACDKIEYLNCRFAKLPHLWCLVNCSLNQIHDLIQWNDLLFTCFAKREKKVHESFMVSLNHDEISPAMGFLFKFP